MSFSAQHVRRTGTVSLPLPPEQVFPLFTPEGERSWITDWAPEYLYPTDGPLAPGLVFRTRAGGERTLWLVTRFDPEAMVAEYVRIVPDSRMGTVFVRCHRVAGNQCEVEVTYELTSLSDAGNATLASLSERAYAEMLSEWRDRIMALSADPARTDEG